MLINDPPLKPKHNDHELTKEWKNFRDCRIKPDLLLIYQKIGLDMIRLIRLGSHNAFGT
jgi:mRNA interferase YafQ